MKRIRTHGNLRNCDSFDAVLPKTKMPPAYTAASLNGPGRTKIRLCACRLVIALGAIVVFAASVHAQTPVFIVSLELGNLAGWLEKLKTDKVITSEQTSDALVVEQLPRLNLFIGDNLMKTLQPTEYTKDDPTWYSDPVQKKEALGRSWLEFILKRDATNKASRHQPACRTEQYSGRP